MPDSKWAQSQQADTDNSIRALAEAKNWLRTLSSEEGIQLTADMTKGVVRGKGQKALPVTTLPQPDDPTAAKTFKPFDHPKYWAAFILIGDPD